MSDLKLRSWENREAEKHAQIHAMANRGLSPHEAAALLYPCETTTYSTWNGGGAASGLRDKAPGARQQLQGDDVEAATRARARPAAAKVK